MKIVLILSVTLLTIAAGASATDGTIDFVHMVAGSQGDYGCAVAVGADGSVYFAGLTSNATDIQASSGALNLPPTSTQKRVFIRKLSPDGSKIVFTAFVGESDTSFPTFGAATPVALKLDSAGNIYVAFLSFNVATTGTVITTGGRITLAKISPGGDKLLYSARILANTSGTYIAIDVDATGAAYVAASDGRLFVSKIDPTGTKQVYLYQIPAPLPSSNTLGGIALGPDQSLYIAGSTYSSNYPTTPGSLKPATTSPQDTHGFLMRLAPDGSKPIFSTYIGGEFIDNSYSVAVDGSGNAYVAGATAFSSFAFSAGNTMQATPLGFSQIYKPGNGTNYGFVQKIDPTGSQSLFSVLLRVPQLNRIALDSSGNVYVAGADLFGATVAKMNSSGTSLLYQSTVPLYPQLLDMGFAVGPDGAAYVAGSTSSFAIPDLGTNNNSPGNAFLFRLNPSPPPAELAIQTVSSPATIILGQVLTYTVTIQNHGSNPANIVVLYLPETDNTNGTIGFGSFVSCHASGGGICPTELRALRVTFPEIAPGATEQVVAQVSTSSGGANGNKFHFTASIWTTASDVAQDNIFAESTSVVGYAKMTVGGAIGGLTYVLNGAYHVVPPNQGLLFQVTSNAPLTFYWPPQTGPSGVVQFQSWDDGNTDNPRTFNIGTSDVVIRANFTAFTAPYITAAGILNSASFVNGPVSPGEELTIFGLNLGGKATGAQFAGNRLTTQLNGTQVLFNGTPGPMLYASATQVSAIAPYGIGTGTVSIAVVSNGVASAPVTMPIAGAAPAIYIADSSGIGPGAILNQDASPNSKTNPAQPGSVVTLFGTGEGLSTPSLPDGMITGSPAPMPNLPIQATVDGLPATVAYAGGSPGSTAGLVQLNIQVPATTRTGDAIPVSWSAGSAPSQRGATLAIGSSTPLVPSIAASPERLFNQPGAIELKLQPETIAAGGSSTKITVLGSGFIPGVRAFWNDQPRSTTFVDSNTLQMTLTARDLATPSLNYISIWDGSETTQLSNPAAFFVYVPLISNDFVYDPQRSRLYLAVSQTQPVNGGTIASLDPATGLVDRYYPLAGDPEALAISDDARYLYVGVDHFVRRIDLTSWTTDLTIDLGTGFFGPNHVLSMVALPGVNTSIAVSFTFPGLSPPYTGTGVFDGAQVRSQQIGSFGGGPAYLAGGPDQFTLYGSGLYALKLTAAGITIAKSRPFASGSAILYSGGTLYTGQGAILNAQQFVQTGQVGAYGLMCPGPAAGQVVVVGKDGLPGDTGNNHYHLDSFDQTTGIRAWTVALTSLNGVTGRLTQWGADGLAFREPINNFGLPGRIYVFRAPLK